MYVLQPLVMFYAVELLRAVEAMHAAGVLHCDIKPDNILLRDDDEADPTWLYSPAAGFGGKGIELIDYGCAIDRNMYDSGTVFAGRSRTDSFECLEMQAGEVARPNTLSLRARNRLLAEPHAEVQAMKPSMMARHSARW